MTESQRGSGSAAPGTSGSGDERGEMLEWEIKSVEEEVRLPRFLHCSSQLEVWILEKQPRALDWLPGSVEQITGK